MLHKARNFLKKSWLADLSPPSARMGSTMQPATASALFAREAKMFSTASRHLCSSAAFSFSNCWRGYLRLGKGATGQGKAGMSILWTHLESRVSANRMHDSAAKCGAAWAQKEIGCLVIRGGSSTCVRCYLERVAERQPRVRPWKEEVKDSMLYWGVPGGRI